jgi:hypothetical protein
MYLDTFHSLCIGANDLSTIIQIINYTTLATPSSNVISMSNNINMTPTNLSIDSIWTGQSLHLNEPVMSNIKYVVYSIDLPINIFLVKFKIAGSYSMACTSTPASGDQ